MTYIEQQSMLYSILYTRSFNLSIIFKSLFPRGHSPLSFVECRHVNPTHVGLWRPRVALLYDVILFLS